MTATPPARRREDGGQATVELALALPAVLAIALAVVQLAILARDQLLVTQAARAAAREATTVGARPSSVRAAAVRSGPDLKPERLSTETSYQGGSADIVTVTVRYTAPTEVPVVGRLLPDVPLAAKAAMRTEPGQRAPPGPSRAANNAGTAS